MTQLDVNDLDWDSVKEALADAIELDPAERSDFLDRRCGGDTTLRATVERLLRGHDSASGFLDASSTPAPSRPLEEPPPPERIGPYSLRERLGEGGFGVVYRATQTEPFERDVAIKILKPNNRAGALAARFRAECDTLARMDHEEICRLLDAGVTPDGSPFVVMELVRGAAIGEHCSKARLGIAARASLIARAARAVHHAHERAVIHCDVKPSNILVSGEGAATRLRLIDFGIARAVDEADPDRRTRSDLAGTPRYMSPERRSAERAADVRSDIYSLGSVLAELVEAAAANSLVESRSLLRDLRAIAAMATAADPVDRYDSAAIFAEDLERALRGESIRALPEGSWRSLLRVVRRRRVASALAATALFAIVVGSGAALLSRSAALEARDEARRQARRAEFVSNFLLDDMLGALDPNVAQGRDVTVLELLTRVDERVRASFDDDLTLRAELAGTLGTAYRHIGREQEAASAFELAIATRQADHPEDAAAILGWRVELAEAFMNIPERHGEALALRAQNVRETKEKLGDWHPVTLAARLQHMDLPVDWDVRAAELEAIAARARELGEPGLAEDALRTVATIRSETGHLPEAVQSLETAVASAEARLGPSHSDSIVLRRALADLLLKSGRNEEANAMFDEVVRRTRAMLPADHPALRGLLSIVATRKILLGHPDESIALANELVAATRAIEGVDSIQHSSALHTLAQGLTAVGRTDEALAILEPLIPALRTRWGERHLQVGRAMISIARAHAARRDWPRVLEVTAEAAPIVAPSGDATLGCLELRATALVELGRPAEARTLLDSASEPRNPRLEPIRARLDGAAKVP
jgi:tetratricopeptide (TPR) repeat protein